MILNHFHTPNENIVVVIELFSFLFADQKAVSKKGIIDELN